MYKLIINYSTNKNPFTIKEININSNKLSKIYDFLESIGIKKSKLNRLDIFN